MYPYNFSNVTDQNQTKKDIDKVNASEYGRHEHHGDYEHHRDHEHHGHHKDCEHHSDCEHHGHHKHHEHYNHHEHHGHNKHHEHHKDHEYHGHHKHHEHHDKTKHKTADDLILDMLRSGMIDEKADSDYYLRLMDLATSEQDKEVLKGISQCELKHLKILEEIYANLTGEKYEFCFNPRPIGSDLANEYESSFYSEIHGFEFYRKLYFGFLNIQIRDMLYEIMTDEQNHALKLSHLYSKLNVEKPMPY